MGQALYRKYRSRNLSEIVGQQPVVVALGNALKQGHISHAYLFTGPRGVGKTSVARIMAHEINSIPYVNDNLPLDIIEIDAASNRRIDEIRDLREKVRIAPVNAQYKVYIIDEVHMLTREAFNALLKTLEEPPAHVIFILATTEAHKLPETIISRTQRYNFKLASSKEVQDHLSKIAKKESITIDTESLELIAEHSGGSMRDAISLLDQIRHSSGNITAELVRQNLGLPAADLVDKLLAAVADNEPRGIISDLKSAFEDGASASLIAEQLLAKIRSNLATKEPLLPVDSLIELAQGLLAVESSTKPDIQLEIALIGSCLARPDATHATIKPTQFQKITPPLTISEPVTSLRPKTNTPTETKAAPTPKVSAQNDSPTNLAPDTWKEVLRTIQKNHNTLYGVLRIAEPDFSEIKNHVLILKFKFPFHQKRMNESRNKQVVLKTLADLGFDKISLSFELMPKDKKDEIPDFVFDPTDSSDQPSEDTQENNAVDHVLSVFGGAEVLE